jgi:hydroxysqualene synthase
VSDSAALLVPTPPPGGWSVEQSFRFCQDVARRDTHNFPVATWLMPASVRRHAACLYAFARLADNWADEPRYRDQREALLDAWSTALDDCGDSRGAGRATHPVFIALRETIATFDIPTVHLRMLLDALRQDLSITRYATREDLLDYCGRSANTAGRLTLWLLGYRDEQAGRLSDAICTGHALVNFWQEVGEDWAKGRIYIPQEDLARFGCDPDSLDPHRTRQNLAHLIADEIAWTHGFFRDGWPLCERIQGRLGLELRLIWWSGHQALKRLEADRRFLLARPSSLTFGDKLAILWHVVMGHRPVE